MHSAPDVILALTSACPHCAAMLHSLSELVKSGHIGELTIFNLQARPERARELGIRSVPWVRIGPFEFVGARSRDELLHWIERADSPSGLADYLHEELKEGRLDTVIARLEQATDDLAALLPILANPEASLNVRLGAGAAFEHFAGHPALADLVPALGELARHSDARVRADACYVLGLSSHPAARPFLEVCRNDAAAEVREIASESLARLPAA